MAGGRRNRYRLGRPLGFALAGVLIAGTAGALIFVVHGGGGRSAPRSTAPLFTGGAVKETVAYGRKSAPPEPIAANRQPALLSHDRALKAAYLSQLAKQLD